MLKLQARIILRRRGDKRGEVKISRYGVRSVDMEALRRDLTTLRVFTSPATNVTDLLAQYQNDLDGLLEIHTPLKRRVVTLRPSTPWP